MEQQEQQQENILYSQDNKLGRLSVLPWSKAAEISIRSIKVRFWRSMITMSSVILAIAFLMSIWTSTCVITELIKASRDRQALKSLLVKNGVEVEKRSNMTRKAGRGSLLPGLSELMANIGTKDKWLIILSLLVCVVGIVNAMLMSVTERFREIGTMKCLGALDKFIIRIFLLESSGVGMIGTAIGILAGFILTMVRLTFTYGIYPWKNFPLMNLIETGLISFFIGSILSVLAAIYPAWTAAIMEPVVAMRVDE